MSENQEQNSLVQRLRDQRIKEDRKLVNNTITLVILLAAVYHFIPEHKQLPTQVEAESSSIKPELDRKPEKATFDNLSYLG